MVPSQEVSPQIRVSYCTVFLTPGKLRHAQGPGWIPTPSGLFVTIENPSDHGWGLYLSNTPGFIWEGTPHINFCIYHLGFSSSLLSKSLREAGNRHFSEKANILPLWGFAGAMYISHFSCVTTNRGSSPHKTKIKFKLGQDLLIPTISVALGSFWSMTCTLAGKVSNIWQDTLRRHPPPKTNSSTPNFVLGFELHIQQLAHVSFQLSSWLLWKDSLVSSQTSTPLHGAHSIWILNHNIQDQTFKHEYLLLLLTKFRLFGSVSVSQTHRWEKQLRRHLDSFSHTGSQNTPHLTTFSFQTHPTI